MTDLPQINIELSENNASLHNLNTEKDLKNEFEDFISLKNNFIQNHHCLVVPSSNQDNLTNSDDDESTTNFFNSLGHIFQPLIGKLWVSYKTHSANVDELVWISLCSKFSSMSSKLNNQSNEIPQYVLLLKSQIESCSVLDLYSTPLLCLNLKDITVKKIDQQSFLIWTRLGDGLRICANRVDSSHSVDYWIDFFNQFQNDIYLPNSKLQTIGLKQTQSAPNSPIGNRKSNLHLTNLNNSSLIFHQSSRERLNDIEENENEIQT